jgi:2'-5' RNA ligase
MSPIPTDTRDRWKNRVQLDSAKGAIYWHILFRGYPAVRATVKNAQAQLAAFHGLHMTPEKWLHATALVAGTTEEIVDDELDLMLSEAKRSLRTVRPIKVSIAEVLYHPEAIMLGFTPEGALDPIHIAVRNATLAVTGRMGTVTGPTDRWTPHLTISYSTTEQPMAPLVSALGREVPMCDVTVDTVSLVIQWGAEQLWDWQPVGTAKLGGGSS